MWLFKEGEDARTIARVAYGDPNLYSRILTANPFEWEPGVRLVVPNTPGYVTAKGTDEGDLSLLRRLFVETDPVKRLDNYYKWNGKNIEPGHLVYVTKKP
jgi:hypothetical protein